MFLHQMLLDIVKEFMNSCNNTTEKNHDEQTVNTDVVETVNVEKIVNSTMDNLIWYKADNNDALAQYELAKYYETGVNVSQNLTKAKEWYLKSANNDNYDANLWVINNSDNESPEFRYSCIYFINLSATDEMVSNCGRTRYG
jgi:Sel1 repeat